MTHPNPNLPDINEDAIREMVSKAMMEGMTEKMVGTLPEEEEVKLPEPKYPDDKVTTNELDAEDSIRMENFLLKQQVESLTRNLEDARREKAQRTIIDAKKGLEDFLVEKHEVDSDKFKISLDPNSYTLSIVPLGFTSVAASNQGG